MFSGIKLDVLKQKRVCFARKMPVETAENTLVGDFEKYVRLVEKPFFRAYCTDIRLKHFLFVSTCG